jgi:hypothetical protein
VATSVLDGGRADGALGSGFLGISIVVWYCYHIVYRCIHEMDVVVTSRSDRSDEQQEIERERERESRGRLMVHEL